MKQPPIALIVLELATGAVQAQTVDQRHADGAGRIGQGVGSVRLTPGETRRVERQQGSIDAQESRMRARDGGHLSGYDRASLQHRDSNASRHLYRAKHNGRGD